MVEGYLKFTSHFSRKGMETSTNSSIVKPNLDTKVYKPLLPQGNGNVSTSCPSLKDNTTFTSHFSRKGMETLLVGSALVVASVFTSHFSRKGMETRDEQHRSGSLSVVYKPLLPQGNGNLRNPPPFR